MRSAKRRGFMFFQARSLPDLLTRILKRMVLNLSGQYLTGPGCLFFQCPALFALSVSSQPLVKPT